MKLTVSHNRLLSIAYHSVGIQTEAGPSPYTKIVNAGGASGLSLGVAQNDFGQNRSTARPYAEAVLAWENAQGLATGFSEQEFTNRLISGNLTQAMVNSALAFGNSDVGTSWIHENLDVPHITKAVLALERLFETPFGQSLISSGQNVEAFAAYAMKVYNQYGPGKRDSDGDGISGFEALYDFVTQGEALLLDRNPAHENQYLIVTASTPGQYNYEDLVSFVNSYKDSRTVQNLAVLDPLKAFESGKLYGEILNSDSVLTSILLRTEDTANFNPSVMIDTNADVAITRAMFGASTASIRSVLRAIDDETTFNPISVNVLLGDYPGTLWIDPITERVAIRYSDSTAGTGWLVGEAGHLDFDASSVNTVNGVRTLTITQGNSNLAFDIAATPTQNAAIASVTANQPPISSVSYTTQILENGVSQHNYRVVAEIDLNTSMRDAGVAVGDQVKWTTDAQGRYLSSEIIKADKSSTLAIFSYEVDVSGQSVTTVASTQKDPLGNITQQSTRRNGEIISATVVDNGITYARNEAGQYLAGDGRVLGEAPVRVEQANTLNDAALNTTQQESILIEQDAASNLRAADREWETRHGIGQNDWEEVIPDELRDRFVGNSGIRSPRDLVQHLLSDGAEIISESGRDIYLKVPDGMDADGQTIYGLVVVDGSGFYYEGVKGSFSIAVDSPMKINFERSGAFGSIEAVSSNQFDLVFYGDAKDLTQLSQDLLSVGQTIRMTATEAEPSEQTGLTSISRTGANEFQISLSGTSNQSGTFTAYTDDSSISGLTISSLTSVNGQPLSAFNNGIDPSDLEAYGFTWQNIASGNLPDSATAVLAGLNPITLATNGQPTPQVIQTPIQDAAGNIIGYTRDIELSSGLTLSSRFIQVQGSSVPVLVGITETQNLGGDSYGITTYAIAPDSSGNAARTLVSTTERSPITGGFQDTVAFPDGRVAIRTTVGNTTTEVSYSNGLDNISDQALGQISGLVGFVQAVRGGNNLSITASGLNVINSFANPVRTLADGTRVYDFPALNAISTVAGGLSSFASLSNAIRNGDAFDKTYATLSTVNYVNSALITNGLGGSSNLAGILNGGSGTVGVLPALGLIASVKAGDPIGIAQSIGTLLNPGFLTTPLGIFLIGASILQAIFAKQPKAWGVASVTYGEGFDNLKLQVNANGELFGKDRVRDQLTSLIDKTITVPNDPSYGTQAGQTIRVGLQAQIDEINASLPADQRIGLIAQRMPGLAWRASDLSDSGYSLVDIDPLTGAQRYPFRRFDDDGIPFSSNPALYQVDLTDPAQRVKLDEALLQAALRRGAIAPLWEVKTAKLQGDGGQVDAGLSEEERAAKAGYAAKLDAAYAAANPNSTEAKQKRIGRFMPVALDLDGDGRISTSTIAQQNASTGSAGTGVGSGTGGAQPVTFNWDGLNFKKQTGWVNANDGFLVLDRDFNQSVDNGTELLSNPLVADPAKGLRSLATWDANGDGKIDINDPIYKQLKIWQDFNQDGDNTQTAIFNTAAGAQSFTVQDEAVITQNGQTVAVQELRSLESLGISAIDYNNGRYEFSSTPRSNHKGYTPISALNAPHNGQGTSYGSIQTLTLDASNDGIRYTPVGAGIKIDDSSGDSTILITQIQSQQAVFDSLRRLTVQGETIGSANAQLYEDGVPMAWNPANPNGGQGFLRQTVLAYGDAANGVVGLLDNDTWGGLSGQAAGLTISAVDFAGSAGLRSLSLTAEGNVSYELTANFNGVAGFNYTVSNTNGEMATAHVTLNVTAVNDAPVAMVQEDAQRLIYGYRNIAYSYGYYWSSGSDNDGYSTANGVVRADPYYAPYYEYVPPQPIFADLGYGPEIVGYGPEQYIPHLSPIASDKPNTGVIAVSDPDSAISANFQVLQNPTYGRVSLDASTGRWSYEAYRPAGVALGDVDNDRVVDYVNPDNGQVVYSITNEYMGNRYGPDEGSFVDPFVVRVYDGQGGSQDITVNATHYGPPPVVNVASSGGKKPIAIDMDGDGFHFTDVDDSNVFFDVNGDGWKRKIAWTAPGAGGTVDGLLAYDYNGDGKIERFDEISFVPYATNEQTDLAALKAAFDTNGDGKFSALDDKWNQFGVWQDANSNGITDAGEFKGLDALGIREIGLTSDGQFRVINGQTVHGIGSAVKADGSTLAVADVTLRYSNQTQVTQTNTDGSTTTSTVNIPANRRGTEFNGTADKDLVFGTNGNDRFITGAADDVIVDDKGDDLIESGSGDDLIYSGAGNDVINGGAGKDTIFAGAGSDLVFGDGDGADGAAGDDLIMLEDGNDVAFGGGGNDFISGGEGNDAISGNEGADKLFGEGGWDALFGQEGDDEMWGLAGNDLLDGGAGADLLSGGEGADIMQGGAGDDIYEVDNALDQVDETSEGQINAEGQLVWGTGDAGGTDTVRSSIAFDLSAGRSTLIENLTLTGEAAINGTGNVAANLLVGNIAANTLRGLEGNDTLDGGLGADTLIGGTGDDTYVIDNAGDSVVELAGEGIDAVRSRVSTALTDNVENLSLIGINAINGTGNELNNDIRGNAAANILTGGRGNDSLAGGGGNDSYAFARGDGQDTITDNLGQNRLVFGADVAASDLRFSLAGANLVISITQAGQSTSDQITLSNWYLPVNQRAGAQRVSSVQFADGSSVALDETALNHAPILLADTASPTEDTSAIAGNVLSNDTDEDEPLTGRTLRVTNAGTYVGQYGTLTLLANGSYSYVLRSGDADIQGLRQGQSLSDSFAYAVTDDAPFETASVSSSLSITITGSNDGPIVQADVDSSALKEDGLHTATGNVLTNDSDVDAGTVLSVANAGTYQGTYGQLTLQASGEYSFSLNNSSSEVQSLASGQQVADVFTLQTTDGIATVASSLTLNITGTNDIPVLAVTVSAQSATEIVAFELNLPASMFTDVDAGETLSYSVTLANGNPLPSWLSFNPVTRRFSGEPAYEDIGMLAISVKATDSQGASATANFNLTVNQSPELTVTGTAGNDNLRGASRNDLLDGGAGADTMRGGRGDDRYVVDNTADLVTEFFNQGNDSIYSSVNYVTPAHVENLFLTGGTAITATGNELNNVLIANAGNNSLTGGVGQDLLAGWLGNDSLDGGQDADVYQWSQGDGRDTITESSANTGTDTLRFGAGISLDSLVSREFTDSAGNRRLFISVLDADGQERADQGIELALSSTGSSVIERLELSNTNGTFSTFTLNQIKVSTVQTNGGNGNDTLTGSRADDRMDGGNGDDTLYGRSGNDILWGGNAKDKLFGEGGDDLLWGGNGDDWLQGGAGNDLLDGDNGKDTLLAGSGDDKLYGGNDADILDGGAAADLLDGSNGEDQLFAGEGNDKLYGGNDSDVLAAGAGDDIIDGDNGTDIIIAGAGNDSITAGNDGDFIDAGSGNDSIDTSNGADFIAGGKGNDQISAGHDSDVIAFNRGDGQDTFITQDWQSDTVSLGGGIRYADMSLAKIGNDLILRTGGGTSGGDQISFKDWYAGSNKQRNNVSRLQLMTAATGGDYNAGSTDKLLNKQAIQLDFAKLVAAFDAARASNASNANGWIFTSASLNTAYVSGSNTQAIGGDLAWRYATLNSASSQEANYGNLNAAGVRSAMNGMGNMSNWTSNMPTPVNPWIALQAGISLIVEQPTGANPTLTPIIPLTQDQLIMQGLGAQAQATGQARPSWL